jgi:CheY-like chemotaxis protein
MVRILVVDDNELVLNILRDILTGAGYEVHSASNGREALDSVRESLPDIIITDFYMPEMNGAEFIRAIRAGEAGFKNVPIIALAGSHQAEEKTTSAGADSYLPKPLQEDIILRAVKVALEKR